MDFHIFAQSDGSVRMRRCIGAPGSSLVACSIGTILSELAYFVLLLLFLRYNQYIDDPIDDLCHRYIYLAKSCCHPQIVEQVNPYNGTTESFDIR